MPHIIKLGSPSDPVRCSFIVLAEPEFYQGKKQREGDQRRWSATALFPYGSPWKKVVDQGMEECAKEKWAAKYKPILENALSDSKLSCLMDGKRKAYDGYQDHWALTAHRKENDGRPLVLDSDRSPIYQPSNEMYAGKAGRIYSGCFVVMQINFWAQDNANGKAIRAELVGIQRAKGGDAFSGGITPDDASFDEITEGSNADDLV
jgi:hypothetical protein